MKEKRHEQILKLLEGQKFVSVNHICQTLDVSEMTIRRDLDYLQKRGYLTRTRGGAIAKQDDEVEPLFLQRSKINADKKEIIAQKAASLIEKGDVIGLGVGSTILALTRKLKAGEANTVVTNWIPNVLETANIRRQIQTFLLSGMVRVGEFSVAGDLAVRAIKDFQIDKYFFSVSGIDLNRGLVDYESGESLVTRAFLYHAKQSFLLVDSSKFGRTAPSTIGPLSLVYAVITDSRIKDEHSKFIESQGVHLITVA